MKASAKIKICTLHPYICLVNAWLLYYDCHIVKMTTKWKKWHELIFQSLD